MRKADTGTAGASGGDSEGGVLSSDNITVAVMIAAPVIAIALLACFCARRRYRQVDAVSASVGARGGLFSKGVGKSSLGSDGGGDGGGGGGLGLAKQRSDRSRSSEAFGMQGANNNGGGNGHEEDLSYGRGSSASAGAAAALAAAAAATQAPIYSVGGSGKRRGGGGGGGGGMAPHDYAPSYVLDTAFAATSRAFGGGVGAGAGRGEENDISGGGGGGGGGAGGGGGGGTDTGRSNSPSEAEDGDAGYGPYGSESESAYVSSPGETALHAAPAAWRNNARGAVHPEPLSRDEFRGRQDRDQYEAEQDEERTGGRRSGGAVESRRGPAASANADGLGANAVAGVPNSSSYFVRERNSDRILARSMHAAGRPMSRRGEVHMAIAAAADASRDDRRNLAGRSPSSP